jgi:WD40 repeat protein
MARPQGSSWQPQLKCLWSTSCASTIKSVVLSSKGKLAASTDSCIFIFDGPPAFSCKQQLRPQGAKLTAIAFSHKGTDVVSGGADGFLKWWQIDTGAETCSTPFTTADAQPQQQLSIPEVACSRAGFIAAVSGG